MVLTLIEAAPPPAAASQRRVLLCCLPQELQGLILQPLLLFGFEAHHLLDLARVERELAQVAVPEQPPLLCVETLQEQGQ